MTKEEFESYISPTYLTFETFKQSLLASPVININNIDSIIFQEVLLFDDNSAPYFLPQNAVAVLINCTNNFIKGVFSLSAANIPLNIIYCNNCLPGTIFIKGIQPPPVIVGNDFYTFLILRFD
jgi:hypothetical protein